MHSKEDIIRLKNERNAVILAHNYQLPEVQDVADFVGDSLGLSIQASETDASVIVFCGVYFMAETAKILSPGKTVLIPDKEAGCPMADMITASQLKALKEKHPRAKVLCYVNTSAEVKAECDFCCTSANAVQMVNGPLKGEEEILFVPDKYLAGYTEHVTGKGFIRWEGYCPTHVKILAEDIIKEKKKHPGARVLVHPECTSGVTNVADEVLSTEGISRYVRTSSAKEFIVGTEEGMLHRLKKENPDKLFYPASSAAVCPNMKRITLQKIKNSLETMSFEVTLSDDILSRARKSIERMIAVKA